MKKAKILFVLHLPPPNHGAAKVGEIIKNSKVLKKNFECKFVPIRSSENIEEIGKIKIKKLFSFIKLFIKVSINVLKFQPDKIYYTPATGKIAFLRDYLITSIFRFYRVFKPNVEIYYHYHMKGLSELKKSKLFIYLLKRFFKDVNLILLSPLLKKEFEGFNIKKIYYLPNCVENPFPNEKEFLEIVEKREKNKNKIKALFLSNMIKEKGYFEVLKLAKYFLKIEFIFAGSWNSEKDKEEFFSYIKKYNLNNVRYLGFVSGKKKDELLRDSHLFILLTKNDAFPLSIIEALSYGLPVFTTKEGSIPYIVDERSGIIINDLNEKNLVTYFNKFLEKYINKETAIYCRKRYLEKFTLDKFEKNLKEIFS